MCVNQAAGEALKGECEVWECYSIIKGWNGNVCEIYTDETAANGTCNGLGACYGLAQSCTGAADFEICGSSGCKDTCQAGQYDYEVQACFYDEEQHGCDEGYVCDSESTCSEF